MIKDITVQSQWREGVGKGFARRLRSRGMVPVAVYGEGQQPAVVTVNSRDLANILRSQSGHNTIFKLALPGQEPATVIIKDWQIDPVKGRLLHADLMRLSLTSTTRVSVPIGTAGEPVGVKMDGGILEIELREVAIECLPGDIPERILVDVSQLKIGEHVTVGDLDYDREKIKLISDPGQVVAGIIPPRLVEEVKPAAAAPEEVAPAEPELVKKGKVEEAPKE